MLGLAVLLLPFNLYEDFVLDAREHGEPTDFDGWTFNALKMLAFDIAVGIAFFLVLYALIEWLPRTWSLAAAAFYTLVSTLVSLAPLLQGPPEDELAELRDPELREHLAGISAKFQSPLPELLRWHGEGADEQALLALQGIGKRRRLIISDAMLRNFTHDEIAALLAHETSHIRSSDLTRFNLVNLVAALLCFLATHAICRDAANELAAFPLLAGALLALSFAAIPLLNAYTRRREYIADTIAARTVGEHHLRTAIEKLNDGGPAPAPPPPFDLLINSQPAHHHRIWRLTNKT